MRRVFLTSFVLVCVAAASASIAWAAVPRHSVSAPSGSVAVPRLTESTHLVRTYAKGPAVEYAADIVWRRGSPVVRFRLPADADNYTATITISFQYRTTGHGHYFVTPALRTGSAHGVSLTPARRSLAPSSHSASTTSVYRVTLHSNVSYTLAADADVATPEGVPASITTSRLLLDLEAWPTG